MFSTPESPIGENTDGTSIVTLEGKVVDGASSLSWPLDGVKVVVTPLI